MLWRPAYVALGANLGEPVERVREALSRLEDISGTRCVSQSRLWRSRPLGPQDQPDYVNAVAGLLTTLEARPLLESLRGIEQAMGRVEPPMRWGPRLIDLDLLMLSTLCIDDPALKLPHPGLPERGFVLYPLAEIAPDLFVPGHGRVRHLQQQVPSDGLEPIVAQDSRD